MLSTIINKKDDKKDEAVVKQTQSTTSIGSEPLSKANEGRSLCVAMKSEIVTARGVIDCNDGMYLVFDLFISVNIW